MDTIRQQPVYNLYRKGFRLLFFILFFIRFICPVIGQTKYVATVPAAGWYRIAYNNKEAGRGFGIISIYTQGGSFVPEHMNIHWFKDWQYKAGIRTESNGSASTYWSEVRMTYDNTTMYMEVYFTRAVTVTLMSDTYGWNPCIPYSGARLPGEGTVRASAKTNGHSNINNRMLVAFNGNVGIGTTDPKAKLAVEGNILAKEIKVTNNIAVPDYVFESDYQLTELSDIETYIKEHKHLPEIPSAEVIAKEGLDLGEMNLLLLKKVEELTLHLIEKEKEITDLTSLTKGLEERLQKLEIQN